MLIFLGSPKSNAHALCFATVSDMEPFAEKPIDNVASISFCTELRTNGGVSGDGSHNSIQFVTVEKLQKPPRLSNCRNRPPVIVCNALTSELRYADVNYRGITLFPTICKVYEMVQLKDLKHMPYKMIFSLIFSLDFQRERAALRHHLSFLNQSTPCLKGVTKYPVAFLMYVKHLTLFGLIVCYFTAG